MQHIYIQVFQVRVLFLNNIPVLFWGRLKWKNWSSLLYIDGSKLEAFQVPVLFLNDIPVLFYGRLKWKNWSSLLYSDGSKLDNVNGNGIYSAKLTFGSRISIPCFRRKWRPSTGLLNGSPSHDCMQYIYT